MPQYVWAQVQVEECNPTDYEFEDSAVPTLCQQYGNLTNPTIIGTGTSYADAATLLAAFGVSGVVSNMEFVLIGTFSVNQDLELLNCTVLCENNASMAINESFTDFTLSKCRLFCCEGMWKGILFNGNDQTLTTQKLTQIEDAIDAIFCKFKKNCTISCSNTTFNRNIKNINLIGSADDTPAENTRIIRFTNNTFQATSALNYGTPEFGIMTYNILTPLPTIAALNDNNKFISLIVGIDAGSDIGQTDLHILNHTYEKCQDDGVRVLSARRLVVFQSRFSEVRRHSISMTRSRILTCTFNNFFTETNVRKDGAHISIASPVISNDYNIERCTSTISGSQGGNRAGVQINTSNQPVILQSLVNISIFNLNNSTTSTPSSLVGKPSRGIEFIGSIFPSSSNVISGTTFNVFPGTSNKNVGIYVNKAGTVNNIAISKNIFFNSGTGIYFDSGIGEFVEISLNTFRPTLMGGLGVDVNGFEGMSICNNVAQANSLRISYRFRGDCDPTAFVENITHSGYFVIESGAMIGLQDRTQNVWVPTLDPFNNALIYRPSMRNMNTSLPIVNSSLFRVNEVQSELNAATQIYTVLSGTHLETERVTPDNGLFTDAFVRFTTDPFILPGCANLKAANSLPSNTDIAAAMGTFDQIIEGDAATWDAKRHLFRLLQQNPDYVNAHTSFSSFLNAEQSTSVGKMDQVFVKWLASVKTPDAIKNAIGAIENEIVTLEYTNANMQPLDMVLYNSNTSQIWNNRNTLNSLYSQTKAAQLNVVLEAKSILDAITVTSIYETNQKTVYDILFTYYLSQTEAYTATQTEQLKAIALQCPETGGKSVYFAYGLLDECSKKEIDATINNCLPQIGGRPAHERTIEASAQVSIAPNPTTDAINVELPTGGRLHVFNISGAEVFNRILPRGKSWVNLGLQEGLYFAKVILENGDSTTKKIVIVK
jgi:hypothetical protein